MTKNVKPVIEALYDALPRQSHAFKNAQRNLGLTTVLQESKQEKAKRDYDTKVGAIITFNDARGRRKGQILDLFDRAIENVQASIPLTIQEQAL